MLRFGFILISGFLAASPALADGTVSTYPFMDDFKTLNQSHWYVSNGWANGDFQGCEWRADHISAGANGIEMRLSDDAGKTRNYTCGEFHTTKKLGYGLYEARMRTAAGSGLNTAFFTYVGPPTGIPEWDEIDFEFLGKDSRTVQVNYYVNGKGGHEFVVPLGFDASKEYHDYAFEWTPHQIRWYVDKKLVHETPDGATLPRNPGALYFSLWSGGKGEDGWLGPFSYSQPATADIAWTGFTPIGDTCQFPQSLKCK